MNGHFKILQIEEEKGFISNEETFLITIGEKKFFDNKKLTKDLFKSGIKITNKKTMDVEHIETSPQSNKKNMFYSCTEINISKENMDQEEDSLYINNNPFFQDFIATTKEFIPPSPNILSYSSDLKFFSLDSLSTHQIIKPFVQSSMLDFDVEYKPVEEKNKDTSMFLERSYSCPAIFGGGKNIFIFDKSYKQQSLIYSAEEICIKEDKKQLYEIEKKQVCLNPEIVILNDQEVFYDFFENENFLLNENFSFYECFNKIKKMKKTKNKNKFIKKYVFKPWVDFCICCFVGTTKSRKKIL